MHKICVPADQATVLLQGRKNRKLSDQQKNNTKKTKRNKVGGCSNDTKEPLGDRIDVEVHDIDLEDLQGDRINPRVYGIDREAPQDDENEILNLPRIVVARRRRPVQLLWYWNRIYPGGLFRLSNTPFTGQERILKPLPRNPSTEDYFRLYIIVDVIDMIVTQTNLYAQQSLTREQNLSPYSLARKWKPTDRAEMVSFFGIIILMGTLHKPRLAIYWSIDTVLSTPCSRR